MWIQSSRHTLMNGMHNIAYHNAGELFNVSIVHSRSFWAYIHKQIWHHLLLQQPKHLNESIKPCSYNHFIFLSCYALIISGYNFITMFAFSPASNSLSWYCNMQSLCVAWQFQKGQHAWGLLGQPNPAVRQVFTTSNSVQNGIAYIMQIYLYPGWPHPLWQEMSLNQNTRHSLQVSVNVATEEQHLRGVLEGNGYPDSFVRRASKPRTAAEPLEEPKARVLVSPMWQNWVKPWDGNADNAMSGWSYNQHPLSADKWCELMIKIHFRRSPTSYTRLAHALLVQLKKPFSWKRNLVDWMIFWT